MVIRATILRVDGATSTHVFDSDEPPLHWLQDVVGGLIDFVPDLPCTVVVNQDRATLQLPLNTLALERFGDTAGPKAANLRGDVIVIEHLL